VSFNLFATFFSRSAGSLLCEFRVAYEVLRRWPSKLDSQRARGTVALAEAFAHRPNRDLRRGNESQAVLSKPNSAGVACSAAETETGSVLCDRGFREAARSAFLCRRKLSDLVRAEPVIDRTGAASAVIEKQMSKLVRRKRVRRTKSVLHFGRDFTRWLKRAHAAGRLLDRKRCAAICRCTEWRDGSAKNRGMQGRRKERSYGVHRDHDHSRLENRGRIDERVRETAGNAR